MKFVSFEFQLGATSPISISTDVMKRHLEVITTIDSNHVNLERVGYDFSFPIDYETSSTNPSSISALLIQKINECNNNNISDILLLDFTSNHYVQIRDPLLIELMRGISNSGYLNTVNSIYILIPQIPNESSASYTLFNSSPHSLLTRNLTINLVSPSGEVHIFQKNGINKLKNDTISKLYQELHTNPLNRLERKCIKRLGHFKHQNDEARKCRLFSFSIWKCQEEIKILFKQWWENNGKLDCILVSDLENNPEAYNGIHTFAIENDIKHYKYNELRSNGVLLNRLIKTKKKANIFLVLDVVKTGKTLIGIKEYLQNNLFKVNTNALTIIGKWGGDSRLIDGLKIDALLHKVDISEDSAESCYQCQPLNLPITSESAEIINGIRTFDLITMVKETGGLIQERESERPSEIGEYYSAIPNFNRILSIFGDWIGFKLHQLIQTTYPPIDLFILKPNEIDSSALCDKIRVHFDSNITVIEIPTEALRRARQGELWENIIKEIKDINFDNLLYISRNKGSAIVLDIFSGSGNTLKALSDLLSYFRINAHGLFCFVDFAVNHRNRTDNQLPIYSLYQWHNPRKTN